MKDWKREEVGECAKPQRVSWRMCEASWCYVALVRFTLAFFLSVLIPLSVDSQTKGRLEIRPLDNRSAGFFYDESHALLIGNSEYSSGWHDLLTVTHELTVLKNSLVEQGFAVFGGRVHTNLNREETRRLVQSFVDRHGIANPDNRLLIVYSGHGATLDGSKGYIVPVDAPNPVEDRVGFLQRALPIREFKGWAEDVQAKHVLIAFDSCFGGTVFSTRSHSKAAIERMTQLTGKPIRAFLTAGGAGEEVPARSVFTPYLSRGINGEADMNDDGYVTGSELFVWIRQKVSDATAGTTKNTVRFGPLPDPRFDQGDFVFVLPVPVDTPKTGALEVKSSRSVKIWIDGEGPFRNDGKKILSWDRIKVGLHTVRVVDVGGHELIREVIVREAETSSVVVRFSSGTIGKPRVLKEANKGIEGVWVQRLRIFGEKRLSAVGEFRVEKQFGGYQMRQLRSINQPDKVIDSRGISNVRFDGKQWSFFSDWGLPRLGEFRLSRVTDDLYRGYSFYDGKRLGFHEWERVE